MIHVLSLRLAALRSRSDRGAVSVEAMLVLPVLFGIFFLIIQGAIWMNAGNNAQAAATAAYNQARLYDATSTDGIVAGEGMVDRANLTGAHVSVDRNATTTTVTVTGSAPTLVPGFNIAVERTVTGPTERWVGP